MGKINLQLFATNDKDKKNTSNVNGVDQETLDKGYNNTFKGSDDLTQRENESDNAYNNYKNAATKQFENSDAYNQAMDFTNSQWDKLSTGKTSWTDDYNNLLNKYLNREDFEYDVDNDPLFQQALSSAMNSGKTAMQDTIGQASALTGGYGSTYATSAGNQAYNSYIEDAYNNLPEYYQMALNAYQSEGQEMYNQVALVGEADSKEFQRNFDLYSASFDRANQIWNQDFSLWNAGINNAFNLYNAANDRYESKYAKEYTSWADGVTQAQQLANLLNTDYWNQTNFDEGVRQFDKNYEQTEKWNQKEFDEGVRQFDKNYEQTEKWNQKEFDANYTSDGKGGYAPKTSNGTSKEGYVKRTDDNGNTVTYKEATQAQKQGAVKAYNEGGTPKMNEYINSIPDSYDKEGIAEYVGQYGDSTYDDFSNWTISTDTYNGGFLGLPFWQGEDHNDVYKNGDMTKTFDELEKDINNSNLTPEQKNNLLDKLKKQSKK